MIVAQVDRDYDFDPREEMPYIPSRVGKTFEPLSEELIKECELLPKTRFRCLDDDRNKVYGGWLKNDSEAEVQAAVLNWAMADAGCTIIEVRNQTTGEWVIEIG